ncbi:MAG: hypothetical protein P8Y70_15120 [Candidatus Lokiarchaeota archaeon]
MDIIILAVTIFFMIIFLVIIIFLFRFILPLHWEKRKRRKKEKRIEEIGDKYNYENGIEEGIKLTKKFKANRYENNKFIEEYEEIGEKKEELSNKAKPSGKEITEEKSIFKNQVDLDINFNLEEIKDDESDLEVQIPEKILEYHEKYSMINGGFVQYEKIEKYIENEIGFVPEVLLKDFLKQLEVLKMIQKIFEFGDTTYYSFKEINLELDEKDFITFIKSKQPLHKDQIVEQIDWDEEKVLRIMKKLQQKGILRIENNKIEIPGVIQE